MEKNKKKKPGPKNHGATEKASDISHSSSNMSDGKNINPDQGAKRKESRMAPKSQLQIPNLRLEKRIPENIPGRTIELRANHYELTFPNDFQIHRYKVLNKKLPWRRQLKKSDAPLSFRVVEELKQICKISPPGSIVFDGISFMFSLHKIPDIPDTQVSLREVPEYPGEVEFIVVIQYRGTIDVSRSMEEYLSPESSRRSKCEIIAESTQVLNVILGMSGQLQFKTIRKIIYPMDFESNAVNIYGSGKSLLRGAFLSVRFAWKPFLNVDIVNKPIYLESSIQDFACKCTSMRNPNDVFLNGRNRERLEAELKDLQIRFKRPDKKVRDYRFNKFVKSSKEQEVVVDGKTMSVEEYFKVVYGCSLKNPHWPCMHVGNPSKTIYLPPELTVLKEQTCPISKKLNDRETGSIIKNTAFIPSQRKELITEELRSLNAFYMEDVYAHKFGINKSQNMILLNARVLNPPKIEYDGTSTISPKDGKWNASGIEFKEGKSLTHWSILKTTSIDIKGFVDSLMKEGKKCGLKIETPLKIMDARDSEIIPRFHRLAKEKPQLIMVILDGKGNIYSSIKYEGDINYGIPTQFVREKTLRLSPITLHNICLKLNSKLEGINQILHKPLRPTIMNESTMIVGADVTHPSPGDQKPSIASVVASFDDDAVRYNVQATVQRSRKENKAVCEVILDMENIMMEFLLEFARKRNSCWPQKIIFYRDGVGEGQFEEVLNEEMHAIQRACKRLSLEYEPGLTLLVAQKRHKTRFFPENEKDGVDRNKNVPPGTVVDSDICHPSRYDFFLVSHEGIQGTTRPTHYHVLWDDNSLSMDVLQKLTYYLCHIYSRCERSVSYPAPTYYAHLAAFRARIHHDHLIRNKINNATELKKMMRMRTMNIFI